MCVCGMCGCNHCLEHQWKICTVNTRIDYDVRIVPTYVLGCEFRVS